MIPDFPPNTAVNLTTYVPVENTIVYHDTNGSLLETVAKTWDNPRLIEAEQTTLPTGQSSLTTTCYNSNAEISEQDEFDLGTGPASLPACANGHRQEQLRGHCSAKQSRIMPASQERISWIYLRASLPTMEAVTALRKPIPLTTRPACNRLPWFSTVPRQEGPQLAI